MTSTTTNTSLDLPRAKILLIGDSLTQTGMEGWGGSLAHVYQRRADIINRGCSGFNTKFYLRLLDNTSSAGGGGLEDFTNVKLITIWFGANDASLPDLNPHHYVSLEEYAKNLEEITKRVQKKYGNHVNILFITPPPVEHSQRLEFQKTRYGDKATGVLERTLENAGKYAKACKETADKLKLPCLDLYNNMQNDDDNWARFLSDGLHFSKEGHEYVAKAIQDAIQEHFPDLAVTADPITGQWNNSGSKCSGLPSWGPYHDEFDHKDIDKAFADKEEEPSSKKQRVDT